LELIVIFFVVVALILWGSHWFRVQQERAITAARDNYLASLSKLKRTPTDADLKQRTLALGRVYSNLTRAQKGNTRLRRGGTNE
jgi:hypothetical protein